MAGKDDTKDATTSALEALVATNQALMTELRAMRESRPAASPDAALSPDELAAKLMAEIRGQRDDVAKLGLVEVVLGCKSDFTDATFDAEIHYETVTSGGKIIGKRPGPGKVVSLLHYKEPPAASIRTEDGGAVPMDMTEIGANGASVPSLSYGQWKWESYWQADIRRFVGRPLPEHVKREAKMRTDAELDALTKPSAQSGT